MWWHRQIRMSPIDSAALVLYRWSVGNFRLSCTVQKLLDIFAGALNLAVILPLKQTFVNLTSEMTPSPTCSYRTLCVLPMRILSHQAFWSVSSVSRYTHKRLSWKSPLTSRKRGVCGSNFPTGWDIFMGPQRHILGRNRVDWCIICGTRALGVGCALAEQNTGKKSASRQFHPYGEPSRDPPPIIMNFGLHGGPTDLINCPNFCFDRLRGFCSVWCWKWPFPIRSDHCP